MNLVSIKVEVHCVNLVSVGVEEVEGVEVMCGTT